MPEVVGAKVLGFVLGPEDLSRDPAEDPAVLEAPKEQPFVGADRVERPARPRRERDCTGVSRFVDVSRDAEHVIAALVVLRRLKPPHGADAKARIPDNREERLDGVAGHRGVLGKSREDRFGLLAR
ncbi:MAG: hypothetical protein WBM75_19860 [Polyangiales bacterium]